MTTLWAATTQAPSHWILSGMLKAYQYLPEGGTGAKLFSATVHAAQHKENGWRRRGGIKHGQKHFMVIFCVGKLARKKNGHFQSTAVKSKAKSRVIAWMMLKCHFSLRVKVKPRYRGDVLLSGRGWFTLRLCFHLNEVGDLSFFGIILFSYSTSPLCTATNKITSEKKVAGKKVFVAITRGHKIVSSRSPTRGIFVASAFLRRLPVP